MLALPHTTDARTWTEEFLKTTRERPEITFDPDTITTWFANAIMAGFDAGQRNAAKTQQNDVKVIALFKNAIIDIDELLSVPAAEYVPSIRDVFTRIDKLNKDLEAV